MRSLAHPHSYPHATPLIDRLKAALEGRYHLVRELGEGGMATVYLAEDVKHRRNMALKVLKPELAAEAIPPTRQARAMTR